jgi:hypothetical protein
VTDEPYPVTFDVEGPPGFPWGYVFFRIALLVVIGWVVHPVGLLWLGLPVVTAILLSQRGCQRYLDEEGLRVSRVLDWILGLVAYIALVTDELPGGDRRSGRARRRWAHRSCASFM